MGRHYSFLVDPDSFAMVAEHYVRQLERRTVETTLEFRAGRDYPVPICTI
ncbi:MAG TPA: hypothetical protein VKR41_06895 [Puia sp.]|nr:hypothetical protein [Puia sp.]